MKQNTSPRPVPHKHAELIKAWADGAKIERKCVYTDQWELIDSPGWVEEYSYRIKHQPVTIKKYTFYDRIERFITNNEDLNLMQPQFWYDNPKTNLKRLEWTFTDGKLTSITMIGTE